jgi:hypothetical protein
LKARALQGALHHAPSESSASHRMLDDFLKARVHQKAYAALSIPLELTEWFVLTEQFQPVI